MILMISSALWAKTITVKMGGGGYPQRPKDFLLGYDFLKSNSDQFYSLYGNGTELQQEDPNFKDSVQSFSEKNINQLLKNLSKQVSSGEIKKGDQILFTIETHGYEQGWSKDEISHNIHLAPFGRYSLDNFRPLLNQLQQAGVRVAIFDSSCYSGNSLELAGDDICVITSSPKDLPAFAAFGELFFKELPKSQNLEEAFLASRAQFDTAHYSPWISTQEGLEIGKSFAKAMYPYDYGYTISYQSIIVEDIVASEKCDECYFEELLAQPFKDFYSFLQIDSIETNPQFIAFKKEMLDYHQSKKEGSSHYQKMVDMKKQKIVIDGTEMTIGTLLQEVESFTIIVKMCETDPSSTMSYEGTYMTCKDFLKMYKRKQSAYNELMQKDEYRELKYFFSKGKSNPFTQNAYDDIDRSLRNLQQKERKLYDQLYRLMIKNSEDSNPCRDFSF